MAPPPACDSAVAPCFHGSPVFLRRHSLLQISSLPSPQSISPQPTLVLRACSPIPTHQLPAPLHTSECTSKSRAPRATVQTVCISHPVPFATDQLLHPLLTASDASLLSQSISPLERGFPQTWESILYFSSPTLGCRSRPASSLPPSSFFFLSYPVMQGCL